MAYVYGELEKIEISFKVPSCQGRARSENGMRENSAYLTISVDEY